MSSRTQKKVVYMTIPRAVFGSDFSVAIAAPCGRAGGKI